MKIPGTPDGVFEGGILFDGCDYRTPKDIVGYAFANERLALIRNRGTHFRVEFLMKSTDSQFSLPVWSEVRDQVLCGSGEDAKGLADEFVEIQK